MIMWWSSFLVTCVSGYSSSVKSWHCNKDVCGAGGGWEEINENESNVRTKNTSSDELLRWASRIKCRRSPKVRKTSHPRSWLYFHDLTKHTDRSAFTLLEYNQSQRINRGLRKFAKIGLRTVQEDTSEIRCFRIPLFVLKMRDIVSLPDS